MIDSLKVENGKYEIVLEDSYALNLYRYGKLWIGDPQGSKMFIGLIYQFKDLQETLYKFTKDSAESSRKFSEEYDKLKEENFNLQKSLTSNLQIQQSLHEKEDKLKELIKKEVVKQDGFSGEVAALEFVLDLITDLENEDVGDFI